ncbi:MAG TPA: hypothetical protein VN258_06040 [Mobilitalea sp.]|nr:hypothetical protein [Mobilitalea sp.]
MNENVRKSLETIGSTTGSIVDTIKRSYRIAQENKQIQIRKAENEAAYRIGAIELSEVALACANAIRIAEPTPQNVRKAYNEMTFEKVYKLTSNSFDSPPIEDITATLNHVLEERRSRRLATPNVKPLYVSVNYATEGYDIQIVGTNLTKGYVLPNIAYGKKIGVLVCYDNKFYIKYPDNTSAYLPLGAKFTYLNSSDNWVDDYIYFDMGYGLYRLGRSTVPLDNFFAKL